MSEWQVELTWVCATCATRVLGRHTTCTGCGKPKEDEEYEMPADVAARPAVTDEDLLRKATAGANWRCGYCGSDQRALDGGCARCGAGRTEATAAVPATARIPVAPVRARSRSNPFVLVVVALVAAPIVLLVLGGVVGLVFARRPPPPPPATVVAKDTSVRNARVTRVSWTRTVVVERWQLLAQEGFTAAVPAGAVDVKAAGERVHHEDKVPDGFDTEPYTVEVPDGTRTESYTVEVPDGTRSETYTERVSCGQDCTDVAPTCRKECTSNKNGFATCRDVCSGGGRSCTPKTCTETRTRQVPKTRMETRTREIPKTRSETRTRQVPRFRSVPRMAPWSTWKAWGWKEDRTERLNGDDAAPRWPEVALAPPKNGQGEERATRKEELRVDLEDEGGERWTYAAKDDLELARLAQRKDLRVRVAGTVEILDP